MLGLQNYNLNLLPVLVAIAEERSLSLAAKRLKLTQPAISHALQKLREDFGDPLFVRAAHGMTPTARADELVAEVRRVLTPLATCYTDISFDLRTVDRRITLAATTYFELRILKNILRILRNEAPLVRLDCLQLSGGFPKVELENGEIDVAVAAYFREVPAGMRLKALAEDPHVCLVSEGHSYIKAKNRLESYLDAEHLVIAVPPGVEQSVDVSLRGLKRERKIGARINNFMTPPLVLAGSDFILTCPRSLAEHYKKLHKLVVAPTPLPVASIEVKMVWHDRTQSDPLQKWFRVQIERAIRAG